MEHVISLAGGIPSDALFDFEGLSIATQQAITEQPKSAFQYGLTEGSPLLRERICALCAERGVTADAEEVMVTAGSQQALDLVMRAIVNPGDVFVVERPTYWRRCKRWSWRKPASCRSRPTATAWWWKSWPSC